MVPFFASAKNNSSLGPQLAHSFKPQRVALISRTHTVTSSSQRFAASQRTLSPRIRVDATFQFRSLQPNESDSQSRNWTNAPSSWPGSWAKMSTKRKDSTCRTKHLASFVSRIKMTLKASAGVLLPRPALGGRVAAQPGELPAAQGSLFISGIAGGASRSDYRRRETCMRTLKIQT